MPRVAIILLLFVGLCVAGNPGLLHAGMGDMSSHETMPGCHVLLGMTAICEADLLTHIGVWQTVLAAVLPPLLVLIMSVVVPLLAVWLYVKPRDTRALLVTKKRAARTRIPTLHQELFSQGLLNPKLPHLCFVRC